MAKKLYHHEAHQILEAMQQKALQYEPPAGKYATSKIPCMFPMEKPLPLKLTSKQIGG